MTSFFDNLMARSWNRLVLANRRQLDGPGLDFGNLLVDGQITPRRAYISHVSRAEHVAVLGRTGTGKSSLLKKLAAQDIAEGRGFVFFDLHGDATYELLQMIAAEERKRGIDLSDRLIVVEPADPEYSVGLNVLERRSSDYVAISEFAAILKKRWGLEHLGARTEELLRNALLVLAENGLTLVELSRLLSNSDFRATCLVRATNEEVRAYFVDRYDTLSDAQQAVYRDAILNKVSEFTSDPKFRHLIGQQTSTFSFSEAIDSGYWVIIRLDKGRLGEQALTLGAMCLAQLKNALFARKQRRLFTIYADEVQNLVTFDSGLEILLSEARKFQISVVSGNQYLDQYPPAMRSAILSVNTQVFFRLSAADAERIAGALDGRKGLTELLKNLPQRHMVIKSGHRGWIQAVVPQIEKRNEEFKDLYQRSRNRWARRRSDVEAEIRKRHSGTNHSTTKDFHDWE